MRFTLKDPIRVANFSKFDASSHVANFCKLQRKTFETLKRKNHRGEGEKEETKNGQGFSAPLLQGLLFLLFTRPQLLRRLNGFSLRTRLHGDRHKRGPFSSHELFFFFSFKCRWSKGYNYPIVHDTSTIKKTKLFLFEDVALRRKA